jgi:hypothetical protein
MVATAARGVCQSGSEVSENRRSWKSMRSIMCYNRLEPRIFGPQMCNFSLGVIKGDVRWLRGIRICRLDNLGLRRLIIVGHQCSGNGGRDCKLAVSEVDSCVGSRHNHIEAFLGQNAD